MSVEHSRIQDLVPRDKFDFERVEAVIAAGYPTVDPILPALLEWVQDMNWPIATPIAEFLASIGQPLVPHLLAVFDTGDVIWQAWLVSDVIAMNEALVTAMRPRLCSLLAFSPRDEDDEWLHESIEEVFGCGFEKVSTEE